MTDITNPVLAAYAESHSTAPEAHLVALSEQTRATLNAPQMMVGALEGRFLEMLVFALRPSWVLEIGTFSGYSSLSMAAGLPPAVGERGVPAVHLIRNRAGKLEQVAIVKEETGEPVMHDQAQLLRKPLLGAAAQLRLQRAVPPG